MKKLLILLITLYALPAFSEKADIFADPENLKVLPKDISSADLRHIMRSISQSLGVRCGACHVGKPEQSIDEYDFASDEKEMKEDARTMMKMVGAINKDFIGKMDGERISVTCLTCHRGVKEPEMTADVLLESFKDGGLDAIKKKYISLREEYYGTHSYDFSASVLRDVAENISEDLKSNLDTAKALYFFNLEYFPQDLESNYMLGEVFAQQNDIENAKKYYKIALSIRNMPFIEKKLKALEK